MGLPVVSVPVLSINTVSTVAHPFEGEPVLNEDPVPCADSGGRDGDHQRDREAERVWARDHEHRDGALDRLIGFADRQPRHQGDDGRCQRHVEEERGGAIGERLGA